MTLPGVEDRARRLGRRELVIVRRLGHAQLLRSRQPASQPRVGTGPGDNASAYRDVLSEARSRRTCARRSSASSQVNPVPGPLVIDRTVLGSLWTAPRHPSTERGLGPGRPLTRPRLIHPHPCPRTICCDPVLAAPPRRDREFAAWLHVGLGRAEMVSSRSGSTPYQRSGMIRP